MSRFKNETLKAIHNGDVIIAPTDTVYGLLCRYDSKDAVEKIYSLKKRDRNKPLILLGYSWRVLKKFTKNSDIDFSKYRKEWPGALTIILPASNKVPNYLNKGFKTIGVRVPNNKFLLELLKECPGGVLASTSANVSGKSDKAPQKEILKKIAVFIKAKKNEMSLKPSKIIEIKKKSIKVYR